jgi:hypothetical protein
MAKGNIGYDLFFEVPIGGKPNAKRKRKPSSPAGEKGREELAPKPKRSTIQVVQAKKGAARVFQKAIHGCSFKDLP